MINKTYNVCEMFLSKEEVDIAIKEYIENHNPQRISFSESVTHTYIVQGNILNGASITLVHENSEKFQNKSTNKPITETIDEPKNESIIELSEEERITERGLEIANSKKKKGSRGPLFSRGGLLTEKVRIGF